MLEEEIFFRNIEQVTKLSLEELGKRGKGGAALVTPRLQLRQLSTPVKVGW